VVLGNRAEFFQNNSSPAVLGGLHHRLEQEVYDGGFNFCGGQPE
jgi:hypothetical protein